MHRLREKKNDGPIAALPVLRPPTPRHDVAPAGSALARPAPTVGRHLRTLPADVAWARLAEPLTHGEGIRVGALGVTGAGKTTSLAAFAAYLMQEQLVYVMLIHDIKLPRPQYPGLVAHDGNDVLRTPPTAYPHSLVLRRRAMDHTPSVEEAAQVTKKIAYGGVPAALLIDELSKATSPAGREFTAPTVAELFTEGRGYGASLLWSAQLPQRVPTLAYDLSRVLLHRSGTKVLSYMLDQRVIDPATANVVSQLETGDFVVVSSEDDFSGEIFQTPAPP